MQTGGVAVSFVARIWLERRSNGNPAWRGHIQHVQTGEQRHFRRFVEIRGFIERLSDVGCESLCAGDADGAGAPHR